MRFCNSIEQRNDGIDIQILKVATHILVKDLWFYDSGFDCDVQGFFLHGIVTQLVLVLNALLDFAFLVEFQILLKVLKHH